MEKQICSNDITLAALPRVGRTQSKISQLSKEGEIQNGNIFMKIILCDSIRKYENRRFKGSIFIQNSSDLMQVIIKDSRAISSIGNSLHFAHICVKNTNSLHVMIMSNRQSEILSSTPVVLFQSPAPSTVHRHVTYVQSYK